MAARAPKSWSSVAFGRLKNRIRRWTRRGTDAYKRPPRLDGPGAQVAQLVEHVTENHGVGGSIPPLGTTPQRCEAPPKGWTISGHSVRLSGIQRRGTGMLYRLVRPMQRKGSRNVYFVQRIHADVKKAAIGRKLVFEVGGQVATVAVTAQPHAIKFSLRSSDPVEVKVRQAAAARQAELHWMALRQTKAMTLSHRQCVALFGEGLSGVGPGSERRQRPWSASP